MHSGMPLYRNHFRRSRDAPEVKRDQLHSTSQGREVNRSHIDAGGEQILSTPNSNFLHPTCTGITQTFCAVVRVSDITLLLW